MTKLGKMWLFAGIIALIMAGFAFGGEYKLHIGEIPADAYGYRIIAVVGSWDSIGRGMDRQCPGAAGGNLTSQHELVMPGEACGQARTIFILHCFKYLEKKG